MTLGLPAEFSWDFLKAATSHAIIGLDFLEHFQISLNPHRRLMILPEMHEKTSTPSTTSTKLTEHKAIAELHRPIPTAQTVSSLENLFSQYPSVFEVDNFHRPTRHQTLHHIRTVGPPVCSKVCRLSPEKLDVLKSELQKLLDLGVIEPTESPYASPVHLVPKKNPGEFRITGDFRLLNEQTITDKYSIPLLTDFIGMLAGSTVFTTLDLYKSYHQIRISPEDVHKTAMITPLGNYAFKRLAMGLKSAGNTFCRFMHEVLRGVPNCFVYIDDIMIFSESEEDHWKHLSEVFNRLEHFGLILNKDKCVFAVTEVDFLGHRVDSQGVRPLETKVSAIRDFPKPRTVKDLRKFLGAINFYRSFIPNAGGILQPLDSLLTPGKGTKKPVQWSTTADVAFHAAKSSLAQAASLAFPISGARISLMTDASDVAVGATLQQEIDGHQQPLGFFSKSLSRAQRNYSTFDRELLAMYLSLKHFRYFLEGRPFTISTDHAPLTHAISSPLKDAPGRRLRQLQFISEFTTDIQHVKGTDNVVADLLSRPTEVNALFKGYQGIDLELLAREQLQDPKVLELRRSNTTSLRLKEHTVPDSDSPLLLDTSLSIPRVIVPYNLRKHVFDAVHSLSHPGIRASRQLISERFVWEGMQKDIAEFTRACVPCQQSKIHRHNSAPLQSFLQPDSRFSAIHCDLVGPLPESCGHAYLLTIIDRFTRHLECIPLREITAKACADAFVLNWVARFGCPQIMTCDRGVQFTSHLWEELCKFLGCKLVHTTAFHPESNGFLERQHRTLKAALKAQENPRDWFSNLGFVLLGIRSSPKSDFEVSSAQLCLGTSLRLPGQFFEPSSETPRTEYCAQLCQFMSTLRAPPPHHHGTPRSYVEKALQTCTHVFVKNDTARSSFDRPYKGPYRVLNKGDKFFTLDLFTRRDVVSIDRLRAAHLLTPDKEPETQQPVEGRSHPLPIQPSQPEASFHSYDEQPKSILRTRHGRIIHKPKRYVHFLLPTH